MAVYSDTNWEEVAKGIQILTRRIPPVPEILTPEALDFVARIHREFHAQRDALLGKRAEKQKQIDSGVFPAFLQETAKIRQSGWQVASTPRDLEDRRVEITGPAEPKMMINALNSGAKVFMADLEDSLSPTWGNLMIGQACLKDAVRRTLSFQSPEGKTYKLNDTLATLVVRPRGWHLDEKHIKVDDKPISASIFDFGLYFFHNAHELIKRGTGPYFYLPKMESHLEARLWNEIFNFAQDQLGIPRGTIRATVLIETITAAFEMDEILYELRTHASGLNAGRWDYIFSSIKKFRNQPAFVLPDRSQVSMTVPFMRAYSELLVKTCHHRGAHAMGGMAAFIPNRKDMQVTETALRKVREDKERESRDGFDGTWVAHPDLVPVAMEIFDRVLGSKPNQKDRQRQDVEVTAQELIDFRIPNGQVTEAGLRNNINVALQYIERWLSGVGAAAIHNLMEDAATAEISRAQIWQWIRHQVRMSDGRQVTPDLYRLILNQELALLGGPKSGRNGQAVEILDSLVLDSSFTEFLTVAAYKYLD